MHLLPLITFFPAALSLAIPRPNFPNGQTVKQDIIKLHGVVLKLDATVQAYNGSPFSTSLINGAPILLEVANFHRVNREGYYDALAASPFTIRETQSVISAVVSTVNKSVPAVTQHLKDKLPAFKDGMMTQVVLAGLKLMLEDHDTFSAAILKKVNPNVDKATLEEGGGAITNIHDVIQDAITYYTASGA